MRYPGTKGLVAIEFNDDEEKMVYDNIEGYDHIDNVLTVYLGDGAVIGYPMHRVKIFEFYLNKED